MGPLSVAKPKPLPCVPPSPYQPAMSFHPPLHTSRYTPPRTARAAQACASLRSSSARRASGSSRLGAGRALPLHRRTRTLSEVGVSSTWRTTGELSGKVADRKWRLTTYAQPMLGPKSVSASGWRCILIATKSCSRRSMPSPPKPPTFLCNGAKRPEASSTADLRELRVHYVDSRYVHWRGWGVAEEVMQGSSDLTAW